MSRHRARFFPDLVRMVHVACLFPLEGRPCQYEFFGLSVGWFLQWTWTRRPTADRINFAGRQTCKVFLSATDETRIHGESHTVKGRGFFRFWNLDPQLVNLRCYTYLIPSDLNKNTWLIDPKCLIYKKIIFIQADISTFKKFFWDKVPRVCNGSNL